MGAIAHRKWAALRALHEDWGAPLSLLEGLMERGGSSVTSRAFKEGWTEGGSVAGLHSRLMRVLFAQIERLENPPESIDEEKRARALSGTAKTLESVAGIAAKLKTAGMGNNLQPTGRTNEICEDVDAGRREEIDQNLARLLEGLT